MRSFEQLPITYYVSRGYHNNEVFISSIRREGIATLEYHARRVSVIHDYALPGIPEDEEVLN